MIEIEDVHRSYRSKRRTVEALRGVDLRVGRGETVGLLGVNGAGKTTLLRILSTLLLPDRGRARVNGHDVAHERLAVRRCISVVFGGERGLYNRLSVRDNVEFFGMLAGLTRKQVSNRVTPALEGVGLADRADSRAETLSKGMRQRLHLAIGLLTDPDVLLLDEPTVGLDPIEADRIRNSLHGLKDRGTTLVLTSHYLADIERLADRIVLLRDGMVAHDLPVEVFLRQTGQVATASIRGTGDFPENTGWGDRQRVIAQQGESWAIEIEIPDWSDDVVQRLTSCLRGCTVTSLEIKPPSLEQVFTTLSRADDA